MDSAWRITRPRLMVGLLLLSLLGAASHVLALTDHSTGLRNLCVLALDVGLVLPALLAICHVAHGTPPVFDPVPVTSKRGGCHRFEKPAGRFH